MVRVLSSSKGIYILIYTDAHHNQVVNGFRSFLGRQTLRFQFFFLGHENFRHVMEPLAKKFTREVNVGGASSWNVSL